jgi:hypothetical protein
LQSKFISSLKDEENKRKLFKNIVVFIESFIINTTVRWWNLSDPHAHGRLTHYCLAESPPGWHCTSYCFPAMEQGRHILYSSLLPGLS